MLVKHTYIFAFGIVDYYTTPQVKRLDLLMEYFRGCGEVTFIENNPNIKNPKWAAFKGEKLEEHPDE